MRVPLSAPTFGTDEIQAVIEVLHSGHVTMGARCEAFETAFADLLGVSNAVFVNSGSSAVLLAMFAVANPQAPSGSKRRFRYGSEVIVPAVTWSTTVWPIVQAGGIPVFVDTDPVTLQMDTASLEAAVSPDTVAICPVHVLGNAVPMEAVIRVASQHGLWIIEDTCEALGTKQLGRFAGTTGDVGAYSFYFSHHITTIEGGMVVTNDAELADLLRVLRAHGWTRALKNRQAKEAEYPDLDPRFLFINTGFNLRPTELQAAMGSVQLTKLESFNKRRVEIAGHWNDAFAGLIAGGRIRPMKPTAETDCTWFGYPVICENRECRDGLRNHLEANGVETRPIIAGNLLRQPAFRHIPHRVVSRTSAVGDLPGADEVSDRGVYWGSHPTMTEQEVEYVAQTVRSFFQ